MSLRPIAISLSPNTQRDDLILALKSIVNINSYQRGPYQNKVSGWFKKYFQVKNVFLFNMGRSALFFLLKNINIGSGDEVIIQAFTCVAVTDPILWTGAKPVYIDVDKSLNIDPVLLEKSISKKTKAIIVQHTFGISAQIILIKKIAQKYNIFLIEDCAHSLGATYNGKKIGTFGDAALFSFGRDKVISSVFGGALIVNNRNSVSLNSVSENYLKLSLPDKKWIFKQLFHPLAFFVILPLYNLQIGKLILFLLIKFKILSKPVEKLELSGFIPYNVPLKFPNALARLAYHQLGKLYRYNNHRRKIAGIYFNNLKNFRTLRLPVRQNGAIYLRFNILTEQGENIFRGLKNRNILLGRWYSNVIDPYGVDLSKIGYNSGSAKNAENKAKQSINLPTYPGLDIRQCLLIIKLIKNYAN